MRRKEESNLIYKCCFNTKYRPNSIKAHSVKKEFMILWWVENGGEILYMLLKKNQTNCIIACQCHIHIKGI